MSLKKFFDEKPGTSLLIGVGIILFISMLIFLFTKDNVLNSRSITGWQVLALQSASFWFWAILITAGVGVAIFFINKYFISGGDSKPFGNMWIALAVFLAIAHGKACTDKANDGITAPKHKPIEKPNDNRESAEDQLKK